MKMLIASLLVVVASAIAWAAPATVTLQVPNMTCAACPITVKKALTQVSGVTNVTVDLKKKLAIVTFDDGKATVAALIKATTDAGYPSMVKTGKSK